MSDATARLGLPMIVPGQAQKEMAHNEALTLLDAALQPTVQAIGTAAPPTDPVVGQSWVIGDSPTGDWVDHPGALAAWTAGGWRFVQPTPGFRVWSVATGLDAQFVDGLWVEGRIAGERLVIGGEEMLSTPATPIADPAGGTTIDSQARTVIGQVLAALRHHNLLETV